MEELQTGFILIDQVLNELKTVMQKIETLKTDLGRMTAQRDQLEAEIKDIQQDMNGQLAARDAEIEKLRIELQREERERKATADLLLHSFSQIQNMMNSVKDNMSFSRSGEQ